MIPGMKRIAQHRDRRMLERALGGATVVGVVEGEQAAAVAALVEPMVPAIGLVHLEGKYLLVDWTTANRKTKRAVVASHQRWKAGHRAA